MVLLKNVFQLAGMLLIQYTASLSQSLSVNVYKLFRRWLDGPHLTALVRRCLFRRFAIVSMI